MIRAWHVCITTVAGPHGTTVGAETAPEAEAIVAEDLRAMAGLIGPARVITIPNTEKVSKWTI